MCQFIETIRVEERQIWNLSYHEQRLTRTMQAMFPNVPVPSLATLLDGLPLSQQIQKLRIVYGEAGIVSLSLCDYHPRDIQRLKLVYDNHVEYAYKSVHRQALDSLRGQRGACDEVIIIKDGQVTDTSYGNLAFYDGNQWYTPCCPLLCGTMRQSLIDTGQLYERDITVSDLSQYVHVSMINAMLPLGRVLLPVSAILD